MTARITFDVAGLPVPQGSMRAFIRGGHAVVTHQHPGDLAAWRHAIATAAAAVANGELMTGPLRLSVVFRVARPAGHTGKRGLLPSAPVYPSTRPDLSKLIRAAEDALKGVVWSDDAQVATIFARKDYAEPGRQPGASFEITERLP